MGGKSLEKGVNTPLHDRNWPTGENKKSQKRKPLGLVLK